MCKLSLFFFKGCFSNISAFMYRLLFLLFLCLLFVATGAESSHTNNWAVLISTSRFWFNYRHAANVLGIYRSVKRLGIPDSQIILMVADDYACNSRNLFPGTVFDNADRDMDLYGEDIEIDYKGYEVTVEAFVRLLTERVSENTPASKRLLTNEHSNILVYMTGHGGDGFIKFQDADELSSEDFADALEQMHQHKRYNEILFMVDTCQANSLYKKIYSPNIVAIGSSEIGTSSYSHHADSDIGVAVIDRFTFSNLEFLENRVDIKSKLTIQDLIDSYDPKEIRSTPGVQSTYTQKGLDEILITDFFGNVRDIELHSEPTKWILPDEQNDTFPNYSDSSFVSHSPSGLTKPMNRKNKGKSVPLRLHYCTFSEFCSATFFLFILILPFCLQFAFKMRR
ncbi:pig-K [Schizosaccharomyces cryophilus OY26]|uniref:Pig-K n=1 Tax=Schizosaccharomyces cryophilus (strain OY26 / ATCC MYA-4695 / CBS 11777 / NBRC 106824 / NRRL Y48691) TaxID=653667 RepID=S9X2I2_SCHCR|nr:pig-K [Schizosaccharomyces cryophilus OY26]EPY51297.1 pig-K [Schizosaccharomyces cryophilus OY26]